MNTKDVHGVICEYLKKSVWVGRTERYDLLAAYVLSTWRDLRSVVNLQIVGEHGSGRGLMEMALHEVCCWPLIANQHADDLASMVKERGYATVLFLDDPSKMIPFAPMNELNPFIFSTCFATNSSVLRQFGLRGCMTVPMYVHEGFTPSRTVSSQDVVDAILCWDHIGDEGQTDQREIVETVLKKIKE